MPLKFWWIRHILGPGVRPGGGVAGSADAELRTEAVERERAGVELGVGGGLEELVRVVFEEGFPSVERADFHPELRSGEARMLDAHSEVGAQRREGGDGVGR